MSIQAISAAVELRDIHPTAKLVLILLANCHNGHSGQCNPDQQRLADEAGVDVRTIRRQLDQLDGEYIRRRTTKLGRGKGSETDYELLFLDRTNCPVQSLRPDIRAECTGHPRHLDRTPTSSVYKDEPEGTGKEPEGSVEPLAETLWNMAPPPARKRSSKANVSKAVKKAIKKLEPDHLISAYRSYLQDPDISKNDYAFAKGLHRWLNDEMWDGYLPREPSLLDEPEQTDEERKLEFCFGEFKKSGTWPGLRYGLRYPPNDARADYPPALYEKFGLTKPGRAA